MSLSVHNFSVRLGQRLAVNSVSFAAAEPGLIGIIGPNGAGKTSLVKALAGLLPHTGTYFLNGKAFSKWRRRSRARALSYLAQGADIHWPLTVERVVTLGRLPHLAPFETPGAADLKIIEEAMEACDAARFRERRVDQLSGGERARVQLARALAVGAEIMLADEPVTYLDPYHQLGVMQVLRRSADEGRLVVAVLHDLTLAARYCDRLLLLNEGRLSAIGTPAEVLTAERLAKVYRIDAEIALPDPVRAEDEGTDKEPSPRSDIFVLPLAQKKD